MTFTLSARLCCSGGPLGGVTHPAAVGKSKSAPTEKTQLTQILKSGRGSLKATPVDMAATTAGINWVLAPVCTLIRTDE